MSGGRPGPGRGGLSRGTLLGVLALLLAAGAGVWWWSRPALPHPPPEITLDDVEPAVAAAIRVARQRVLENRGSGEAWGVLGKVFLAHQYRHEGRECLEVAMRLAPAEPRWPYLLAGTHLRDDNDLAVRLIRRAIGLAEGRHEAMARLLLVELLLRMGDLDEAEAVLAGVKNPTPEQAPRVTFYAGTLAARRRRWDEAVKRLPAVRDQPACRRHVAAMLAVAYAQLGREEEARVQARLAESLPEDPRWEDEWLAESGEYDVGRHGTLLMIRGQQEAKMGKQALEHLFQLDRETGGKDYMVASSLGMALRQEGRLEEAEKQLRKALALAPDRYRPHYHLAGLLLQRGELAAQKGGKTSARLYFEEAEAVARKGAALAPLDVWGLYQHSRALVLLGREAEAVPLLRKVTAGRPEELAGHLLLGEALARLDRRDEAKAAFAEAVAVAGDNPLAARSRDEWLAKWAARKP